MIVAALPVEVLIGQRGGDDVLGPRVQERQDRGVRVLGPQARAALIGEEFEAGPGTFVFVRDSRVHRHAVALEALTTVLSFGGPPIFEPSGWEWSSRAEPLVETDPARARVILEEGARERPDSASVQYALARLEARQGYRDAALAAARKALELVPAEQREELRSDMRDHAALRDEL